ncbi:hypothetical protein CcCBS67573_g09808 [Chytriomyces confervae]|uniref:Uncharacterized protein n=1 Tax=Chytriomyces confervae TaxID=246404 RepID=A0A507DPH4_9FUNG|nr:hypothetical protein CcCBS67573_g09808 [Chytriomyces confervae]
MNESTPRSPISALPRLLVSQGSSSGAGSASTPTPRASDMNPVRRSAMEAEEDSGQTDTVHAGRLFREIQPLRDEEDTDRKAYMRQKSITASTSGSSSDGENNWNTDNESIPDSRYFLRADSRQSFDMNMQSADDDASDSSILDSQGGEHGQREYYAHDPSNTHHNTEREYYSSVTVAPNRILDLPLKPSHRYSQQGAAAHQHDHFDSQHGTPHSAEFKVIPGPSPPLSRQSSLRWANSDGSDDHRDLHPKSPPIPASQTSSNSILDQVLTKNPKSLLTKQRSRISGIQAIYNDTPQNSNMSPVIANATIPASELPADTDPYLLKLIGLTSASKPVQSPPQPRSTSIHLQESLYTSESGRTSPIGSFETHQNPSVLQVTPTVPHIASQPPFLNSAASPRQKFEPLPGTLARSNRYKTHIATKYELMQQIHKLRDTNRTSRLAVYNPLAVIRYRREMWQAAVKEKAPATDVRKLRMLRTARGSGSGWTVDDDEVREYIDAVILASTHAVEHGGQQQLAVEDVVSKPSAARASFTVLSTVASNIDKDTAHTAVTADPIGEPTKSPRNNHTMLKGMNKLFGMGRKPGGGGDEKGKSLDGAGKLDASASNTADLNPTVSAGGILSTEIHPDDATSRDRKDFGDDAAGHHGNNGAGRRFVNRVRTGTGALNSLLGKGHAKKRGDHHHTSSSRRGSLVSESGHHVVEYLPSSSPTKHVVVVEESNMLNMLLGGHFGNAGTPEYKENALDEFNGDTHGGEDQSTEVGEMVDMVDALKGPMILENGDPVPGSTELHSTSMDPEESRGRISITNPFRPGRHLLRSPERGSKFNNDIERWMGGVGNSGKGNVGNASSGHGLVEQNVDESRSKRPLKMRLGTKISVEGSNLADAVKDTAKDAVVYLENMQKQLQSSGSKRRQERKALSQQQQQNNGDDSTSSESEGQTNLFGRRNNTNRDPNSSRKKLFSPAFNPTAERRSEERSSATGEKKRNKRLMRLGKQPKTSSETVLSALPVPTSRPNLEERESLPNWDEPVGNLSTPVIIRRKSSKRFHRKGQSSGDSRRNESITGASQGSSLNNGDDVSDMGTTDTDALPVIPAQYVNDIDAKMVTAGKSVQRVLDVILENTKKEHAQIAAKFESYNSVAKTFGISPLAKLARDTNRKDFSSLEQINALSLTQPSLLSPKFITHEAQFINLNSNLSKINETVSSIAHDFEQADKTIQQMIADMEALGKEINETASRKVKVLEDHLQMQEALRRGPMNSAVEVGYQFLEALLIVLGYLIWIGYMGYKGVKQGYSLAFRRQLLIENTHQTAEPQSGVITDGAAESGAASDGAMTEDTVAVTVNT